MSMLRLGRTEIKVLKNAFGALPIQRISRSEAVYLLKKAYDSGITFYDTARYYTDSEEKLAAAFRNTRDKVIIATKTASIDAPAFWRDLDTSLKLLNTDYIDIYQFHNTVFCPKPGDESGLYDAMLQAQQQGKVRFIGFTNHHLDIAKEAVESGLYDTIQFPFSYISDHKEVEFVDLCQKLDVGFLAMKALAGGLIKNSGAAYAFLAQYANVLPLWGIQTEAELDEFISHSQNPPVLSADLQKVIDQDKQGLAGDFCRGCGYCTPCPVGIEIFTCAKMSLLLRRAPVQMHLSDSYQAKMRQVEACTNCGQCKEKCPYGLDIPRLLQANYADYQEVLAGKPV